MLGDSKRKRKVNPDLDKEVNAAVPKSPDRAQWSSSTEFLLSCISLSVGMGNFYRFPFVASQNGGGAFLFPYLIVLIFIGKPMYFLELAVGQFSSSSQIKIWEMSPIFRGIGYGSTLCSFFVNTYCSSIMALSIYYFFASFRKTLPWAKCDPSWAGQETCDLINNSTGRGNLSISQLYFEKEVLKQKANIEDGIGYLDWKLTMCMLATWLVVFFSLVRGVKSSGKVAYFTAIFPYVVLLVLLITGCTKPGAWDGILFFVTPQWDKMLDPNVWYAAVGQCFFSLATGFGPIIMNASYNPFRQRVHRDAMIVSFVDTFTSILSGLTVFAILGHLADQLGKHVSEVVDSGPGMIFVSYADAISKFTWVPQLFAALFFLMMFSLGAGSVTSWHLTLITVICDQLPEVKKLYIVIGSCCAGFLLSLVYCTTGGQFVLTLVDYFAGTFTIYIFAILECIGIAWFYGIRNITRDIEFMLGIKLSWFWKICWTIIDPAVLSVILVYSLVTAEPLKHEGIIFPPGAIASGWAIAAICLIFLPIGAIYTVLTDDGPFIKKIRSSIKPTMNWGPRLSEDKLEWEKYKNG